MGGYSTNCPRAIIGHSGSQPSVSLSVEFLLVLQFQNPRHSSSLTHISLCITFRVRDGKRVKEDKNKSQHLGFLFHNALGHTQGIYKV